MDDAGTCIDDGAVAILGGRIVEVGPDKAVAASWEADRVVDASGAPVHPGLVEAHLHASYQTFRSALPDQLAEDDSFDTFESVFYNCVTDRDEYLSVALASIEMIRNGTTCFLEAGTVLSPDSAADAVQAVGIRAVLGDSFIWDQPHGFAQGTSTESHARPELVRTPQSRAEALAALGRQIRRNTEGDALVTGHVAVLGLGTASEELLLAAKERADAAGVVLNMHQSYSPADTEADRRHYGTDPLLHLAAIGLLDTNVTLAHANHLTDAECDAVLESQVNIAWAPAASMMWGHGGCFRGRHAELWRRGAHVGLASDSPNWSNDFDLFRQANLAVLTAREAHQDRTYLTAEDGLYMATRGGARAAGLGASIGSLEIGKRADLVVHTLRRPELVPPTDQVRNLVYAARSKSVHTVIVNGRIVLDEGVFTTIDENELLAEVSSASSALLERMGRTVERNLPRLRPMVARR